MATLQISNFSRFKDSKAYTTADGRYVFAPMEGPREFTTPAEGTNAEIHTVRVHEVGFLDLIAVAKYGPGYERLWWAIALANAMIDPEREMYAGQRLVIPPRATVAQFLSRPGDATSR
jgi:nucleoid-associated protein YgaU